ncbi:MAG: DNRLRE domain-containing protein [Desulfuromonadaceae bacterium]
MKRLFCILVLASLTLVLSGCGGGSSSPPPPPPTFEARILSNPTYDGDITYDGFTYAISPNSPASVFAGIDPVTRSETRAFLNFSLSAVSNTFINSARLDLYINSFTSNYTTIPIRIELVSFTPPLVGSDFDRIIQPPLETVQSTIFNSDVNNYVSIDVTRLVATAQSMRLANFQIRILEDLGPVNPGLFEINDATTSRAPLLDIIYQ